MKGVVPADDMRTPGCQRSFAARACRCSTRSAIWCYAAWRASSRSRTRRAAWARPPPPSISPRPRRRRSGACCWSTSIRRATRPWAAASTSARVARTVYHVLLGLGELVEHPHARPSRAATTWCPRTASSPAPKSSWSSCRARETRAASDALRAASRRLRLHPDRLPAVAQPADAERLARRAARADPDAVRVLRARRPVRSRRTIKKVRAQPEPAPRDRGLLRTMYDPRNTLAQQVSQRARSSISATRSTARSCRATCGSPKRRATACRR